LKITAERRKRLQKEYNELHKGRRRDRFARGKETLKDIEAVQKANKRRELICKMLLKLKTDRVQI
jgi:hypothetical protein